MNMFFWACAGMTGYNFENQQISLNMYIDMDARYCAMCMLLPYSVLFCEYIHALHVYIYTCDCVRYVFILAHAERWASQGRLLAQHQLNVERISQTTCAKRILAEESVEYFRSFKPGPIIVCFDHLDV